MADYLFGETEAGISNQSNNELWATKFTCTADSNLTEIQVYSRAAGNVKVALYSDSGGSPDSLIVANDSGTSCSASQWNPVTVTSTGVSSGTDYWLVCLCDTIGVISRYATSGGTSQYNSSTTYSTWTAPATYPSGTSSNFRISIAAFGSAGTSYESDLGTGSLSLGSGTPVLAIGKAADLGTGALSLGADPINAVDAALGTGNLSLNGGSVSSSASLNSDLGTGALTLGAVGVIYLEHYLADLGTGNLSLGAQDIDLLESYESDLSTGTLSLGADPLVTVGGRLLNYNQGRLFALRAEVMRGCIFADNYASAYKTRQIGGTVTDGAVYGSSVTLDGLNYITYNQQPLTDTFSAVVKFSASAVSSGVLFGTTGLLGPTVDGWQITVDATGIRANHSDGTSLGTQCTIDFDYADGETHTVTYVVDMVSGDHTLYVDAEDDTQSTSATGTIGTGKELVIGGLGFAGTIETARLFNTVLSSGEHAVYYSDSLSSLIDDSIATYRCDSVCDQTNHIWTKTLNLNDLTKGDGVSAGYPTQTGDHYEFDGVDDYVSDWPTQPLTHTDSIAKTTSYPDGIPVIQQVNDDTIKTLLTTSGSYTGNLHSLVLCTGELTNLEKKQLEYRQLKGLTRETYVDPFHHSLMVDGANVLHLDFRDFGNYLHDYSNTGLSVTATGVTWDTGLSFGLSSSNVTSSDDSDLRLDQLTIVLSGTGLDDISGSDYLVIKDGNYALYVSAVDASNFSATLNGSSLTMSRGDITHIAVSAVDGAKPRFYLNGEYQGEGSSTVTLDDSTTNDIVIGNVSTGGYNFSGRLDTANVYNVPLTDLEIRRSYHNSMVDKGFSSSSLIAGTESTGAINISPNQHSLSPFTAEFTGNARAIKYYSTVAGNVKVNVYSDNGGAPDALLASVDEPFQSVIGWNEIPLGTSVAMTLGTDYWIGNICDTTGAASWTSALTWDAYYRGGLTFSSFTAPDPLPIGSYNLLTVRRLAINARGSA